MCAQVDTNNAITILKYRLEVPEDLNPTSPIWNYNTQVAGQVRRPPSRLGARALSSQGSALRGAAAPRVDLEDLSQAWCCGRALAQPRIAGFRMPGTGSATGKSLGCSVPVLGGGDCGRSRSRSVQ